MGPSGNCRASCLSGSQLETDATVVCNAGAALHSLLAQPDAAEIGVDLQAQLGFFSRKTIQHRFS